MLQRFRLLLYPLLGAFLGVVYGILWEQLYVLVFNPIDLFRFPAFSPYGFGAGLLIGAFYATRRK